MNGVVRVAGWIVLSMLVTACATAPPQGGRGKPPPQVTSKEIEAKTNEVLAQVLQLGRLITEAKRQAAGGASNTGGDRRKSGAAAPQLNAGSGAPLPPPPPQPPPPEAPGGGTVDPICESVINCGPGTNYPTRWPEPTIPADVAQLFYLEGTLQLQRSLLEETQPKQIAAAEAAAGN